jgi:acetyltransferase-like isoleucine patch superfamily enzyme
MLKDLTSRAAVRWARFWMRFASLNPAGRVAMRIATVLPLPYVRYYLQQELAALSEFGYVAGSVRMHHHGLQLGHHVFIDDEVRIVQDEGGGAISLGERVYVGEGSQLGTGQQGSLEVGAYTSIGPHCRLIAYVAGIRIGAHTMVGPDCHFYSYNHGTAGGGLMQQQRLEANGDITVADDVWIGRGATILSGVQIATGAVVGAGTVVTCDVPPRAIVAGNPGRVVGHRSARKPHVVGKEGAEAVIVRRLDAPLSIGIGTPWRYTAGSPRK